MFELGPQVSFRLGPKGVRENLMKIIVEQKARLGITSTAELCRIALRTMPNVDKSKIVFDIDE